MQVFSGGLRLSQKKRTKNETALEKVELRNARNNPNCAIASSVSVIAHAYFLSLEAPI